MRMEFGDHRLRTRRELRTDVRRSSRRRHWGSGLRYRRRGDSDARVSAEAAFYGDGYFSGRRVVRPRWSAWRWVAWLRRGSDGRGRLSQSAFRVCFSPYYPLLVRDYETVNLVSGTADERKMSWREIVKASLVHSTIYGYIGGALQLFASAAIVAWIPSYLNRYYGLALEQAAVKGRLDCIGRRNRNVVRRFCGRSSERSEFSQQAAFLPLDAICSGVLFAAAFALAAGRLQFALIAAAVLFVGGHMGPVAALAAELNHLGLRATALSVVTLVYNLLGLAPGPLSWARSDSFAWNGNDGYSAGLF